MYILEKIEEVLRSSILMESGMRNITKIAKYFDKAVIYFHQDLDGVTSAIGLKEYLSRYGIKTIDAQMIQYGDMEYQIPKPMRGKGILFAMVDFAHSKPMMHLWTDHHDVEHSGASKDMSLAFVHTPSNADYISSVISPSELFPPEDLKIISMVDSAAFAGTGLKPEDIMRSVFTMDKTIDISKNKQAMGLVTNKLTLVYKNKPGFLKELVLQSNPSLKSIYNVILRLVKEKGYRTPKEYEVSMRDYTENQKNKAKEGKLSDVKSLKNGESIMLGNTIVQYGGGSMMYAYDRYTPFKTWPSAQFMVIAWPMGMVQVSKNPFIKGDVPVHLGELCADVLKKFKSKMLSDVITLGEIKKLSERGSKENIMGFTFRDFMSLFKNTAKGLGSEKWSEILDSVSSKEYKFLSQKQKDLLDKVTVTAWDIVKAQSGGHKSISNIQLSMIPDANKKYLKDIFYEVAKEMKDKELISGDK